MLKAYGSSTILPGLCDWQGSLSVFDVPPISKTTLSQKCATNFMPKALTWWHALSLSCCKCLTCFKNETDHRVKQQKVKAHLETAAPNNLFGFLPRSRSFFSQTRKNALLKIDPLTLSFACQIVTVNLMDFLLVWNTDQSLLRCNLQPRLGGLRNLIWPCATRIAFPFFPNS